MCGLSAPFLVRPNELYYNSANKVLLPCLPRFWSLWLLVNDPGQKLMGVPLPQSLDAGCSGGVVFGVGARRLAAGGFFLLWCPCESLQAIPLGRMGFCRELGKRRKQEVDVAWKKIRWKRGN